MTLTYHNINNSSSSFENEDKHISAIRTVRNEVAHMRLSEFTDNTFEQLWQKMTDALAGLGVAKTDMEKIKSMNITGTTKILAEAEQLKQKANLAFNEGKFTEAIDNYTRILQIDGLGANYQAIIYSNRSAAYLRQSNNDASSLSKAIQDAKLTIQMRPTWWRAYQRLGMAYKSKGKLEKALEQLETALALEPPPEGIKTIRDEISALRQQIGVQSGGDYLAPHPESDTEEEWFDAEEDLSTKDESRHGLSTEEFQELKEITENHPEMGDEDKYNETLIGFLQEASMEASSLMQPSIGFKHAFYDDNDQYVPAVKTAAQKGSKTAMEVLTIWECERAAMDAFKSGDHQKMVQQLATAIRLDHQLAEVPELFKQSVEKRLREHPDELDTIVCHIQLNLRKVTLEMHNFIEKYLEKFPTDPFLVEMHALVLSVRFWEYQEAIECVEKALNYDAKNVRLLYLRASLFATDPWEDSIYQNFDAINKAWDEFLAVAPVDHRKVPAAYYRKAENLFNNQEFSKGIEFFEKGLSAEKKLLPCFLPYDVVEKYTFERMYSLAKNYLQIKTVGSATEGLQSTPSSTSSHLNPNPTMSRADLHRRLLLTKARDYFAQQQQGAWKNKKHSTINVAQKPNPPSMVGLKKITIGEMSPDTVYNGHILEVWTIDWPIKMVAIQMSVEDEHGNAERLAIYNWPNSENTALMLKTFGPRRKLSIINPHLRIARDGERLLRVESPEFVVLGDVNRNICHCCGTKLDKSAIKKCAKCKMSVYCSKECQTHDWKESKHKVACKHLGKYAAQMAADDGA